MREPSQPGIEPRRVEGGSWHGSFAIGDRLLRTFTGPMILSFNTPVQVSLAAAVPEPGTLALTTLGMLGMGVLLRRRRKKQTA
jgi:hypothetical protein